MESYEWQLAALHDVPAIIDIAQQHFEQEVDQIFTTDPECFARHLSVSIVEQAFDRLKLQLIVARQHNYVIAYSWLTRGHYMTYAKEELAEVAFAHVRMDQSPRLRIQLIKDMIAQWQLWCQICRIPILVSSTIRADQSAFLRLHERNGFQIRGSFAFKRISNE